MLQAANHGTIHVRLRESVYYVLYIILYAVHVHVHCKVSLFIQMYEMFDSNPASWAALVAQLVEHLSGVQSVVGSNPT